MEIRPIKVSDADKFVDFYTKLAGETDYLPFTVDEVAAKAEQQEEYIEKYNKFKQVFVAVNDDEEIVGYLGISRSHLSRLTHSAKFTVGVLEEYQRQGVASELVEFAEEWAEDQKIKRMELTVVEGNEPAVSLFKKLGYEKEGVRKDAFLFDDDYVDEVFMAKMI